jgi:hypothetical protein
VRPPGTTTLLLLILCTACGGAESARPRVDPSGPPSLQTDLIQQHVREFETDLAERRAGTQGEQAASAYILGHLQRAGYVVLLDSVPLADLVRSTNVVARPPSGTDPDVVVTVSYDEPPDDETAHRQAESVAMMLELARALRVVAPDHSVQFVALGAEHAPVGGGRLGSRRLAQTLLDAEVRPLLVSLATGFGADRVRVLGDVPPALATAVRSGGGTSAGVGMGSDGDPSADVFKRAGFDVVVVAGPPADAGAALLQFLSSNGR